MADRTKTKIKPGTSRGSAPGQPSLSGFKNKMAHGVKWVWWGLLIALGVGSVAFFSGAPFSSVNRPDDNQQANSEVVAKVDNEEIKRDTLTRVAENMTQQRSMFGQAVGLADEPAIYAEAIKGLVQQQVELAAAKKSGIQVTDDEYDKKINEMVDQGVKSQQDAYESPKAYADYLTSQNLTQDDVRQKIKDSMYDRAQAQGMDLKDALHDELLVQDYKAKIEGAMTLPRAVRYSEIVITSPTPKPKPGAKPADTQLEELRADAATKKQADAILQQLKSGGDFAAIAKKSSTDTFTKDKGGDAGWALASGPSAPPYLKDADKAKVGQLLGPTLSGHQWYIIKITGETTKLPPKPDPTTDSALQQAADEQYQKQMDALVKQAKVTYLDPALEAATMQQKPDNKNGAVILADYQKALAIKTTPSSERAWVAYAVGQTLMSQNKPADALNAFRQVVDNAKASAEGWMAVGDVKSKLKKPDEALAAYKKALKYATGNLRVLLALQGQFRTLKDNADVAEAGKQIQKAAASQQGGFGGMGGMFGGMGGPMGGPGGIQMQPAPGGASMPMAPGSIKVTTPAGKPLPSGGIHLLPAAGHPSRTSTAGHPAAPPVPPTIHIGGAPAAPATKPGSLTPHGVPGIPGGIPAPPPMPPGYPGPPPGMHPAGATTGSQQSSHS